MPNFLRSFNLLKKSPIIIAITFPLVPSNKNPRIPISPTTGGNCFLKSSNALIESTIKIKGSFINVNNLAEKLANVLIPSINPTVKSLTIFANNSGLFLIKFVNTFVRSAKKSNNPACATDSCIFLNEFLNLFEAPANVLAKASLAFSNSPPLPNFFKNSLTISSDETLIPSDNPKNSCKFFLLSSLAPSIPVLDNDENSLETVSISIPRAIEAFCIAVRLDINSPLFLEKVITVSDAFSIESDCNGLEAMNFCNASNDFFLHLLKVIIIKIDFLIFLLVNLHLRFLLYQHQLQFL